jgi:hypothetical protein
MNLTIANDARPQVKLLMWAIFASLGLYVIAWFVPMTSYLVYPLQLFATFVHEGGHALAAVLTGSEVSNLTVWWDGSGEVRSNSTNTALLLISSAGYLGTTAFGTMLLVWMRYGFSSRIALYFASAFVGIMTVVFGLIFPIFNLTNLGGIPFTVLSGAVLTAGLFAIAKYAELKWANFALAFLSVQCLLNAFFSLKDLFIIATQTDMHNDAMNMAEATGVPSVIWVLFWIGISVLMISIGLRIYAVAQKSSGNDSLSSK